MTIGERVRALEQALEDVARRVNSLEIGSISREKETRFTIDRGLTLLGILVVIIFQVIQAVHH